MNTISQKYEILRSFLGEADVDVRGVNAQFRCPLCVESKSRGKRKLAIRLEDGLVHCWVCGFSAKNPFFVASKIGASSHKLEEIRSVYKDVVWKPLVKSNETVKLTLPDDYVLISETPRNSSAFRYLDDRGVSLDAMRCFRLGLSGSSSEFDGRVIFPSFSASGELNYITSRTFVQHYRKYYNVGNNRTDIVFNEIDVDWKRELILVEGPFDLISCYGMNATTLLGSWMDENYTLFSNIVLHNTPVVLALDQDASTKQAKITRKLIAYGVQVRVVDWSSCNLGADPSSVGSMRFKSLVRNAVVANSETYVDFKLNELSKMRLSL